MEVSERDSRLEAIRARHKEHSKCLKCGHPIQHHHYISKETNEPIRCEEWNCACESPTPSLEYNRDIEYLLSQIPFLEHIAEGRLAEIKRYRKIASFLFYQNESLEKSLEYEKQRTRNLIEKLKKTQDSVAWLQGSVNGLERTIELERKSKKESERNDV